MDTETAFDELAGIRPGVTTVRQLHDLLGEADEVSPSTDLSDTGDSGTHRHFKVAGIGVFYSGDSAAKEATIDDVQLLCGNTVTLRCGLHIGMARQTATEIIRRLFAVIVEYDDSIYFRPSQERRLVACGEFVGQNAITILELYIDDSR